MANFEYIARTGGGEEVAGVMQAENEAAVLTALDERKLYPVKVAPQIARSGGLRKGRKIRPRDLGVIYGQLADLLRAGVPMLRALDTLTRVLTNRRLEELVTAVRENVAAGKTLADSMGEYPATFAPLHCAMVRAGERAGFLEDVLSNLSQFIERQDELRSKVRGALIYPMLLTVIGSLMMIGVLVGLVPKFKTFFVHMSLPLPTQILFALSDALVSHLWLILSGGVLLALAIWQLLRSEAGRRAWDNWRLKVPLLGLAVRMVSITRFCRILGTMLANGVPILQSLAISKDAAGCFALSDSIERAAESVREGQPLAAPLKASGLFPAEIIEMIAVAEESNQMEKVLVQIADTVERRTNRQVDQAVRLIEPLVLLVIAMVILFVAVGLLYPIFTMGEAIK